MTKGFSFFFMFYILVIQPALGGWLRDDARFYQLAGFNAGIFLIIRVISMMCPYKSDSLEKKGKTTSKTNDSVASEKESNKKDKDDSEEMEKEEKSDKIMKEPVSIPKIVQPLTSHTKKKKKRDLNRGQWIILIITLCIAGLIARVLQEFFGIRSVTISLLIGRLLYIIIGKVFDIDGFYEVRKTVTNWIYVLLVIIGIGYGVYMMGQSDKSYNFLPEGWGSTISSYVTNRFKGDEDSNTVEENSGVVYVFEGTGEVIGNTYSGQNEDTIEESTGDISTGDTSDKEFDNEKLQDLNTGAIVTGNNADSNNKTTTNEDLTTKITMGEAVKSLLSGMTLSTSKSIAFSLVSYDSELYPYFRTAFDKKMIGKNTDPNKIISCETYITMKGILQGRSVGNYSDIKAAYWDKATEMGVLNGCKKGAYVTKGNL